MLAATALTSVSLQQARATNVGGNDAEISSLKQQLLLLENRLDKLQKETSANATVAANAKTAAEAPVGNAIRMKYLAPPPG